MSTERTVGLVEGPHPIFDPRSAAVSHMFRLIYNIAHNYCLA